MDAEVRIPTVLKRKMKKLDEEMNAMRVDTEVSTPSEPEIVEVAPAAPVAPPKESTPEYWEHRFKTLQGISNAEKSRYTETISNLTERLGALETQLVKTEKQIPRKFDLRKYFSEEEIENLDERQLEAAVRGAVSEMEEGIDAKIKAHVAPLDARLKQADQKLADERIELFWTRLEASVPNWKDINNDKGFHEWLSQEDYLTGRERQAALTEAESNYDAKRVVNIFKAFQSEKAALKPPAPDLSRKVVPTSEGQPPINVDGREAVVIRRSEIRKFYNDQRAGKYRGRMDEVQKMERKISLALSSGKVLED